MKCKTLIASALILAASGIASAQNVLFFDDFNTPDSKANWEIKENMPRLDPAGVRHDYAFGVEPTETGIDGEYSFFDIPEAPRSSDTNGTGLWMAVQLLGGENDGLNFYTKDTFTGNIRVTVDVFMRWGGSGSTEYMGLGIFHSGDQFNNFEQALDGGDTLGSGGDGYIFWMDTDGDCGDCDYLFSKYVPGISIQPGDSDADPPSPFGWGCGDWNFSNSDYNDICLIDKDADPLFAEIFPAEGRLGHANGNVEGAPANDWATVMMEYIDGTITVYLNGVLVHTYNDPDKTYTSGKIMLAWEDPFTSLGSEQMGWFDNFEVVQLESSAITDWSVLK
ncbi:MAG: DUF1080 domain-containing protein [bacterium]|nr:DUF1080 domain-containing protein [bacterium]